MDDKTDRIVLKGYRNKATDCQKEIQAYIQELRDRHITIKIGISNYKVYDPGFCLKLEWSFIKLVIIMLNHFLMIC